MRTHIYLPFAALLLLGFGCGGSDKETVGDVAAGDEINEEVTERSEEVEEVEEVELKSGDYDLDVSASSMLWIGTKVTGEHTGTIEVESGSMRVEDGIITEGSIVIDMTSIDCCEEPEGPVPTLVEHLNSEDFFSTEEFPAAEFVISKLETGEVNEGLDGTLTIKGIENEIEFPVTFEEVDDGYHLTGTATLDRSLWDIRYGSSSFFSDLGDSVIHDDFTLEFDVTFVTQ